MLSQEEITREIELTKRHLEDAAECGYDLSKPEYYLTSLPDGTMFITTNFRNDKGSMLQLNPPTIQAASNVNERIYPEESEAEFEARVARMKEAVRQIAERYAASQKA